jgi:glycosyltransferase involved in cell wall biosynthesis
MIRTSLDRAKAAELGQAAHGLGGAMGLQILLLTRYGRTGASSRLRFLQYLPGLDEYDIDVHPAPFLDDAYLKELYGGRRPSMSRVFSFYSERLRHLVKARDFDAVWIEKEVLPWVPHWVDMTALGSLPLVVDFDDAWHLRYSGSSNPLVRGMLGRKLERIARRADFVVVANKFLQSWAESTGTKRVNCIPTVVDLRRYPQTAPPPAEPFTIGWIGTPETAPYLETIKGALAKVLAKENTRLLVVGAGKSFLPLANVESEPWSEKSEASLLHRMHVGIMPLPHGAWEYGKSGYKLVQYMAASRPVVASPIGVNCDVVQEGANGFFAITEDEWVANLERFRGNLAMTAALGLAARETVETAFSLRATLPKIAEILQAAAALRKSSRRTPSRTAIRSGLARSVGSSGAAPFQ